MAVVGDILNQDLFVVDTGMNPLIGAATEVHDGVNPSGAFGFHVEETGGGHYMVTSNPTTEPGEYGVVIWFLGEADPDHQKIAITWDVDAAAAVTVTYSSEATGRSLAELRRMVARQLRDYRQVNVESGSQTTASNQLDLTESTNFFRGAEAVCISGHTQNIGKRRKVDSSTYEGGTITFVGSGFPQPLTVTDKLDLFNFGRNARHTIAEYDQAINDAIVSAFPHNREKVWSAFDTMDTWPGGEIAIPDEYVAIYGVEYKSVDWWYPVEQRRDRYATESGYYVDRNRRIIILTGAAGYPMDNMAIRLYGYARARELVNDDDRTNTDAEWIVDQASGMLLRSNLDQATFAIGQSAANRADQLRGKMSRSAEPNTVSLL